MLHRIHSCQRKNDLFNSLTQADLLTSQTIFPCTRPNKGSVAASSACWLRLCCCAQHSGLRLAQDRLKR